MIGPDDVRGVGAAHLRGLWSELGAVLTGRRTFGVAQGWGGNHAWGPAFVLTHEIPAGWPRPDSTVHFVTDGIESAVRQAKAAARGKSVGLQGADTMFWSVPMPEEKHATIDHPAALRAFRLLFAPQPSR